MPTQRTPNAGIVYPQTDDDGWDLVLNAALARLDGVAGVGQLSVWPAAVDSATPPQATGLGLTVSPGYFFTTAGALVKYPGGAAAAAASATTYVWLTEAGVAGTGVAWPAANHVRLAAVTADAARVTAVVDARCVHRAVPAGSVA